MREQISYTKGELKALVRESRNEFKPVIGPNVERDDKSNSEKSYKDAKKMAQDFDGGLKEPKKGKLSDKTDGNRTTLDYNPTIEPDEDYKKRVQAQAEGYNSTMEKESKTERNAEFDSDGKIYQQFKKHNEEINDKRSEKAHAGLVGKNTEKTDLETNRLYENKRKAKRLTFKNTRFLNESSMLNKIPEDYKVDGQVIHMNDAYGNEYIVECVLSEKSGVVETNVVKYNNEKILNEQLKRIDAMMNYNGKECRRSTNSERINEAQSFQNLMNLARGKN